jgi:hypothetical protein
VDRSNNPDATRLTGPLSKQPSESCALVLVGALAAMGTHVELDLLRQRRETNSPRRAPKAEEHSVGALFETAVAGRFDASQLSPDANGNDVTRQLRGIQPATVQRMDPTRRRAAVRLVTD